MDIWFAYELSWLNTNGKPRVAIGEFVFPCESKSIIESKSFKLYLNSFNQTKFKSLEEVRLIIETDLTKLVEAKVEVNLFTLENDVFQIEKKYQGQCIDELDISIENYELSSDYLMTGSNVINEILYSNLLRSNCPITNQPDWGTIFVSYSGLEINHEGLLKYIISYREHNEFHEQCVERIFQDILTICAPTSLSVYAKYTRRGGLDINPYRSTENIAPKRFRLIRQ